MNIYNAIVGGIAIYNYSQKGMYLYKIATTTTATVYYLNSWYKYFKGDRQENIKIITVTEHNDDWIEIKNIK